MKNGTYYKLMWRMFSSGMSEEQCHESIGTVQTLRRLANKHHKLAEFECNGEGFLKGRFYTTRGSLQSGTLTAYVSEDVTIFEVESNKVEKKIKALCEKIGLRCEFQGDPRGYTVKLYNGDSFLDIQG